jgi:hypothetical protein
MNWTCSYSAGRFSSASPRSSELPLRALANDFCGESFPAGHNERMNFTLEQLEALKAEILALYPDLQEKRLKLGAKLLELQLMLAKPGYGSFTDTVRLELKIPLSTAYDTMNFAKVELERIRLYGDRKDEDDITFTWDELDELLRERYPEDYKDQPPRTRPYIRSTQLHLFLDDNTRRELVGAWKIIKGEEALHRKLSYKVAKEIINAAAKFEARAKRRRRPRTPKAKASKRKRR